MMSKESDNFIEQMFNNAAWLGINPCTEIKTKTESRTGREIELEIQISKLKESAIKDASRLKARDFALKETKAVKEALAAENWDLIKKLKAKEYTNLDAEFKAAISGWKTMYKQVGTENEELKGEINYATKQAKVAENILNNIIEEQRDTIIGYNDLIKDLTKKLNAVESVWQIRFQNMKEATHYNYVTEKRRADRLERELEYANAAYHTQKRRAEEWKARAPMETITSRVKI